jgi:hypothetical protein
MLNAGLPLLLRAWQRQACALVAAAWVWYAPGCQPLQWVTAAGAAAAQAASPLTGSLAAAVRHIRCHLEAGRSAPPRGSGAHHCRPRQLLLLLLCGLRPLLLCLWMLAPVGQQQGRDCFSAGTYAHTLDGGFHVAFDSHRHVR